MKDRILKSAIKLFFKYGIRSVTMDDIAKELGISKKTIYQHFADKDQIVNEVIDFDINCSHSDGLNVKSLSENPVDELLRAIEMIHDGFALLKHALINDLKKYYPGAWEKLMRHKDDFFIRQLERNLEEGKKCGLYRDDINVGVLARMRLQQIESGLDEEIYPSDKYSIITIQIQFSHHFIRGILSEKGFETYNLYSKQSPIESTYP